MRSPLFSRLGQARVQYCEDEPPDGALHATRPPARQTTWSPNVHEADAPPYLSICAPDEGRSVLALTQQDRRVPKPPGLRKKSDGRARTARRHGPPNLPRPARVATVHI